VLIGDVHRGVLPALRYARALSPAARALYVEVDPENTRFRQGVVVTNVPYHLRG
jgi:hypothetical protein